MSENFDDLISGSGILKRRTMSGSGAVNPYDPNDPITFGYGDSVNYWLQSAVTCEVQPFSSRTMARDRMMGAGIRPEYLRTVFFPTVQANGIEPKTGDMLEFPSGSKNEFWLGTIDGYHIGNTIIGKVCFARWMYQSGSPLPEVYSTNNRESV